MRILPKINSFHAVADRKNQTQKKHTQVKERKKNIRKHEDGLKQMFSFIASLNIL